MRSDITRKAFFKSLALSSLLGMSHRSFEQTQPFDPKVFPEFNPLAREAALGPDSENCLVINVLDFGAKGDGTTDDTDSIQRAVRSNALIFFPAGTYLLSKTVQLHSLRNIHIWAIGAVLINSTLSTHLIQIEECSLVTITGGAFTRKAALSASWPTDRHCMFLLNCRDVVIREIAIEASPGMGICILHSDTVRILNNTIRNTTRDGVYSHYSVNIIYQGNYLENIADDALSMHDYGFNSAKHQLLEAGYPQAGSSIIANNRIRNCMRGIAAIGLQTLVITNNVVDHTVTCGIDVYNTAEKFEGPDANTQDIMISNNLVSFACSSSLKILGKIHGNGNQGGAAKAAITVGSFSADYQYNPLNKRIANISVTGNMVNYSAADAYFFNNIDGLVFSNNSARNCNTSPMPPYTGYIVECWSCTDVCGFNNNVTDHNSPRNAFAGYRIRDVTGSIGGWLGLKYVTHPESKSNPKVLY